MTMSSYTQRLIIIGQREEEASQELPNRADLLKAQRDTDPRVCGA